MADDITKLGTNNTLDDENVSSSKFMEEQFPERIIFPEELNKFLQDRIQDLTAENECLRQAFEQAEEKLRKLSQEKLNSQNTVEKSTESTKTKLIELGKKYRNQTAEVETLKTKCKNLEATLVIKNEELERQKTELQQILKSEARKNFGDKDGNQDNTGEKDSRNNSSTKDDERIKCLKNKLQRAQTKLCESRNTCATLRQEINKAQKLLYSELGENVNINTLSSVPGNWRGRAEQIRNTYLFFNFRNGVISDESLKCRTPLRSDSRPKEGRQISPLTSPRGLGEPNEYVTLALAAEAERVRLLELVTVLNQRLDKERNEANALIELLHKEKSKCAKLELKLRNLEKERVGLAKVDSGYRAKSYTKMSNLKPEEETNSEEVRFKIELLEEECLALKARLDTVQQDKTSDLAMYKRMLDQTRKTFKDACRNKPSVAGGSRSTITI